MTNDALSGLDDLSGLKNESELPHLSDAISYETDIAPYRYIQIYAGVGSGKNTFINRFVNGDPEKKIPKMIVLVITSRRSKVDELHADEEAEYAYCVSKTGNMTSEQFGGRPYILFGERSTNSGSIALIADKLQLKSSEVANF